MGIRNNFGGGQRICRVILLFANFRLPFSFWNLSSFFLWTKCFIMAAYAYDFRFLKLFENLDSVSSETRCSLLYYLGDFLIVTFFPPAFGKISIA